MFPANLYAEILFESGWENPGAATSGNCADQESGEDCTYGYTCLDAYDNEDGCKLGTESWDNLGVQATLDLRTQTDVVHSGSYAFEIECRDGSAELRYDLLLEYDANHDAVFDAFESEYYLTYWIYFSSDYKFPSRFKGIKFHDNGNAYNSAGGDSISTKVGASGTPGYGLAGSDDTEKESLLSTVDTDHGHLILSNYASHSVDYPSEGDNECHTADDVSSIGTNHPMGVNQDMSGPADNGSNSDPYWPGGDNAKVYFTVGKWYQVILYQKIHDTEGIQSAWIREGDSGTLYKVIHVDKDAWAGTTYDLGTYDTRCFRPGASSLLISDMALPAGTINAGHGIPVGAKIFIDDLAIATTFADVENYGLSTPEVPANAIQGMQISNLNVTKNLIAWHRTDGLR